MSDIHSRIAIVTGATSGIGEATVRKFIAAGFGVVGNGRNQVKLTKLEKEFFPSFHGIAGDATDIKVLERLFALIQMAAQKMEKDNGNKLYQS
jgi:NADP-dependent 3-hydroxy acid dehydrogenase YdfG